MNHQTMNVQSMEQGAEPGWSRSEFLTGSGPTCNRTAGRYWGRTSGAGNPSGSWSIWRASLCAAPVGTAAADQPGWATVNSSPARSWWLCPRLCACVEMQCERMRCRLSTAVRFSGSYYTAAAAAAAAVVPVVSVQFFPVLRLRLHPDGVS